jgi:hypothetical protein
MSEDGGETSRILD